MATKQQQTADDLGYSMDNALSLAMDQQRPFSWTVTRPARGIQRTDVQAGVYLKYSQQHFQTYKLAGK